jgi:hypothetical protein
LTDGNNAFSLIGAYGDNERGLLHALSAIENTGMMIPRPDAGARRDHACQESAAVFWT